MRLLYSAVEAVWKAVRSPLRAVLGEERLGKMLDALGLRALKTKTFVLETTAPDGARLSYRPPDQCIIDEIYHQHAYGPAELYQPGQTVLDVGGHIGTFSVFAAKRVGPTGRVVSCEPGPDNVKLLRENLQRNGLTWARVQEAAISDKPGQANLYIAAQASDNPAANTMFPEKDRKAVSVRVRTLDEIVAEEGLSRVDHLKLDIEGYELNALRGAPKTLAMTARVIMEVHPDRLDPQDVLDFLTAAGLKPEVLSKKSGSWLVEAKRR